MISSATSPHSKLDGFDLVQSSYKKIGDHEIRTDLIIPQSRHNGKRPVIARFHGGGLITGDSLSMDWFPTWLLDLAKQHDAVIVSPNYRLMPESTSLDIFEDIEDFWSWLHSSAAAELLSSKKNPIELDLTRIITAGESAGGLLSICLALAHPDKIRAATASYPSVDMASPHFSTPAATPLMQPPIPESFIDEFMVHIKPGATISSAQLPNRVDVMLAAIHYGKLLQLFERGVEGSPQRELRYPFERMDQVGVKIPRGGIAILQGQQDDIVPPEGNEKFVARVCEVVKGQPGADKVLLTLREGAHGFDSDLSLEEKWLQIHLKGAVEAWLE